MQVTNNLLKTSGWKGLTGCGLTNFTLDTLHIIILHDINYYKQAYLTEIMNQFTYIEMLLLSHLVAKVTEVEEGHVQKIMDVDIP